MKFPKFIIIPISAMLLSGCGGLPSGESTTAGGGSTSTDPGVIIPKDDYYNTDEYNLNGTRGAKLQYEIHRLCLDTHRVLVYYKDVNSYLAPAGGRTYSTDQVSADVAKNQLFYTGKQVNLSTSGATREHVWPCAKSSGMWVHSNYTDIKYYVDGPTYAGGGSDLYHVRPCTSSVNTIRGDSRYKEFSDAEKAAATIASDGGPYTLYADKSEFANYSEPPDEFKGDIVRILMYVYVHYCKMGTYNWEGLCGNLRLQDVMGYSDEKEMQKIMVKWNNLDPVSETEKLRNQTVQAIQGNRNPFVDYPHLMAKCFNL